jgi:UDP-4-amino-4,6-dideoxy-N-acetyl-beta-L-altrosamine N-acetyltransferase
MKIFHGNLVLRSLIEDDLDLLRGWRNDPQVNEHLLNRGHISSEAQLDWFIRIDPEESLYLIAEKEDVPFGLIYATGINWAERSFWGNIIVGNPEFRNSHVPVKMVLMFMWYFFHELGFDVCNSKVMTANTHATLLNKAMGFELVSEGDGIRTERCTSKEFFTHGKRLLHSMFCGKEPSVFQNS